MVRSATRHTPRSRARAVVVARPSVLRTLRVTSTEVERHAAAGAAGSVPVLADLGGQRRADRPDGGRNQLGTDRLAGDPEVAHQNRAGSHALVEPVGAVPSDDGGAAAVDLDAPVVD